MYRDLHLKPHGTYLYACAIADYECQENILTLDWKDGDSYLAGSTNEDYYDMFQRGCESANDDQCHAMACTIGRFLIDCITGVMLTGEEPRDEYRHDHEEWSDGRCWGGGNSALGPRADNKTVLKKCLFWIFLKVSIFSNLFFIGIFM